MTFSSFKSLLALTVVLGMLVGDYRKPPLEPFRVGVFLDLSGRTSSYGQSILNGIKLAVAEINARELPEGHRVELIIEDDSGQPTEAATIVQRLLDQKTVHVLLGGVSSANALAAAPIAQHANVPMLTTATHPAITQIGTYIFRAGYVDPFQGEALAQFAIRTLKVKRVAMLVDNTSDYSKSLATAFEKSLTGEGGQIVKKQIYSEGDKDFTAQLIAIRWSMPDAVLVPGYHEEAGLIAQQAKRIGLNQPLLGGDGWHNQLLWNVGGSALNGSYITDHYAPDSPAAANKEFVAKYKAQYGQEPDAFAALGYDCLKLLADAVKRAGATRGPALREALAGTRSFQGVTGRITMDENRNASRAVILRLEDGKFVYAENAGKR
jgi:branched-chain amino acid transport system substrate-binding protein